jgi:hypothetical protein
MVMTKSPGDRIVRDRIAYTILQRLRMPAGTRPHRPAAFPFLRRGSTGATATALNGIFEFDFAGKSEQERSDCAAAIERIRIYSQSGEAYTETMAVRGKPVYLICWSGDRLRVEDLVKRLASKWSRILTLDDSGFAEALETRPELGQVGGWLDVLYDYLFFVDKTMYEKSLVFLGFKARGGSARR